MLKICPTCTYSAAIDAMFCARCGVSIAHVEAADAHSGGSGHTIQRPATPPRPSETRHQRLATARTEEAATESVTVSHDEEAPASHVESFGLARTIGAVAGAMLRGAIEGAIVGGDCARRGATSFGNVFLTADGNKVFAGTSTFSSPLYVIEGEELKEASFFGKVLARLDGDKVRLASSFWGDVIATIDGPRVYRGQSTWGQPIAYIQGERAMLGVAAAFYLLRG